MVWQGGSMTELSQAVAAPVIDQADTYRHRARFIWPLEVVAAVLLVAIILLLLTGVTSRYVFSLPIVWIDEATSTSFLWLAMLGAATRRLRHPSCGSRCWARPSRSTGTST